VTIRSGLRVVLQMGFLLGDLGMPNMRWIVGRSGRQLLAVCALSLALTAAVLAFGGVALSTLGVAPGPLPAAGSGAAGVFTIVTPTATPTAERRPAAPTTFVIPTRTVTRAFRAPTAVTARTPRSRPSAPVSARAAAGKQRTTKKRAVRRRRTSRAAPAAAPAASVAAVAPAPAHHAAKEPTRRRGRPTPAAPRAHRR
jgi:hypothetical protein